MIDSYFRFLDSPRPNFIGHKQTDFWRSLLIVLNTEIATAEVGLFRDNHSGKTIFRNVLKAIVIILILYNGGAIIWSGNTQINLGKF